MAVRKRNEFLEASDSEAEAIDLGYDSDAIVESKSAATGTTRSSKRRKIDSLSSNEDDEDDDEETNDFPNVTEVVHQGKDDGPNAPSSKSKPTLSNASQDPRFAVSDNDDFNDDTTTSHTSLPHPNPRTNSNDAPLLKPTIPKSVSKAAQTRSKSGVIYISRVPPFMKPQTLRHLLEPHARKGVGRIFLTPEDAGAHARRVRNGGNKKKSYADGWVEFASKREAKSVVAALNGNIIGGKKGHFYHDDLWAIKYLRGFKWSHLTEQIANENAEHAARVRDGVRRTREENRAFRQDFERGKMLARKESKALARGEREGQGGLSAGGGGGEEVGEDGEGDRRRVEHRRFKQKAAHDVSARAGRVEQSEELQSVLSKIF